MYVDVRNRSELVSDGKIVGSVNLPCKLAIPYHLIFNSRVVYIFLLQCQKL